MIPLSLIIKKSFFVYEVWLPFKKEFQHLEEGVSSSCETARKLL